MTVVGNTVMHHLALGLSPLGMSAAPFAPALAEPVTERAADLGIAMNPEGMRALPAAHRRLRRLRRAGGHRRHAAGGQAPPGAGHRHRHQHRDRARRRRPHRGHERRLRSGLRGLPDVVRHEGRRGRHREGPLHGRRRAAAHRDHRRPAGRSASAARAWSTCWPGWCAAAWSTASGRMQPHPRVRQGASATGSSTCSRTGPPATSSSPSTTSAPCSSPRAPSPPPGPAARERRRQHRRPVPRLRRRRLRQLSRPRQRAGPRAAAAGTARAHRLRRQRRRRGRPDGAHRRARAPPHGGAAAAPHLPRSGHRTRDFHEVFAGS